MPAGSYRPPALRDQLVALLVAAACSILFLGKTVWPGFALLPYPPELVQPWLDDAVARGEKFDTLLVGNASMGDKLVQSLPWDHLKQTALREGCLRLWSREIGGGMPFVPQIAQVYQPWNVLFLLLPAEGLYGILFFLHQVLFGWLAYRFLRRVGVSHPAAVLGEVALVLGLWVQARVHHYMLFSAALPLFWMLSCVHEIVARGGGRKAVAHLALGTAISALAGFPAVTFQCLLLCATFALVLAGGAERGARLAPLVRTAAGVALGLVIALPQLVPMLAAMPLSSRGAESPERIHALLQLHALQPGHLLGAVWPDLIHWPADRFIGNLETTQHSWAAHVVALRTEDQVVRAGHNYTETAFAFGIPALALLPLGLAARPRPIVAFFAGMAVLGVGLALATPGLLDAALLVRSDRLAGDVRRFLFLPSMCLPVVAAFGADRWIERGPGRVAPALLAGIAFGSAGLWISHLASDATVVDWYARTLGRIFEVGAEDARKKLNDSDLPANLGHLRATFLRASCVAALALVLVCLRRMRWAPWALSALIAAELAHAGAGTIVPVGIERLAAPRVLAPALAQAATGEPQRIQRLAAAVDANRNPQLLPPNLSAWLGLEDLGLYAPQPPKRLEDMFLAIEPERKGVQSVVTRGAGISAFHDPQTLTHPLLDLLCCRWILSGETLAQLPAGLVDRTPKNAVGRCRLYERTTTLPWVTFLQRARIVTDANERVALLGSREHDPAREVVLEDRAAPLPDAKTPAAFQVLSRVIEDERIRVEVETDQPGWLRIADPWDPGWTAKLDGIPHDTVIADHYLRAIWLKPGKHVVEMSYDAFWLRFPRHVALVALAAALLLAFARGRTR